MRRISCGIYCLLDSDGLSAYVPSLKAEAGIPAKRNRKAGRPLNREVYKDRNKVECFFKRGDHYRCNYRPPEEDCAQLQGNEHS